MEKKIKKWVTIREKGTGNMVGIYYNPYNKPVKYIIDLFIPKQYQKDVYARKTS